MISCDFCLKMLHETKERQAISNADGNVHICFECVDICIGIVDQTRMKSDCAESPITGDGSA